MSAQVVHSVYLIGIGGIGMSALARWYKANGCEVAGYDRTATVLTEQLQSEGIPIHFEDSIQNIPPAFAMKDVLVVYTPAVPKDSQELNFFQRNGNKVIKRSEALGDITKDVFTVAVAGTHGKTTTSSMIAHVLRATGKNCFAFLGGITQNYDTNLLFGDFGKPDRIMVVEADEYDRSFLRLSPDVAVITAMDPDHLDIYTDEADFVNTFNEFAAKLKEGGSLVYKKGLPLNASLLGSQSKSFGGDGAQYQARLTGNRDFTFNIETEDPEEALEEVSLLVPGFHNIQNALAAYAVTRSLGIAPLKIKEALQSFKGVKRRFEYIIKTEALSYIDDYAHHPTEINAFLSSVRNLYPEKKLTVIFQPHLFSRTRDFLEGFAESLSLADKLILLDIYPARELPIPGITSALLLEKTRCSEKKLVTKAELMDYLKKEKLEVLVTIGAGDIDQFVEPIEKYLQTLLDLK